MQQELSKNKYWLRDLFSACWQVLNFSRRVVLNLIFIFIAIVFIAAISAGKEQPVVITDHTVLKLNLIGDIVEEKTFVDPYDEFFNDAVGNKQNTPEILLTDVLEVLKQAQNDQRIQALMLDLHGLRNVGLSKLQEIGKAIKSFKETSGKSIFVYGDYFSQSQYYLASQADRVTLHPMGAIGLDGFGRYRMYYKSALEKLKINSHVFRVGTYKSAVEPYLRDDMSEDAKLANQKWLGELWTMYKEDISDSRSLEVSNFDEKLDSFLDKFKKANGNFAQFAKQNGWVDDLMSHQEFDQFVNQEFGGGKKAKFVNFDQYLKYQKQNPQSNSQQKVAVVVAKGTIYDGKRKPGEIGGHSTAELLKQARQNTNVKAVVLRVDSPGGSAFASEIIRNEIEALKKAGKPVVASMSSTAASRGYWISASADEIWAAPSTVTGSIGIFGMFMTFEDTMSDFLNIRTDGVGTTEMSGLSPFRTLSPQMGDVIQLAIEQGYDQFISLVATERNMSKNDVDTVAQGRVWSGKTALELGLVDKLGFFDDAIQSAAALANLDTFGVQVIKKRLSPMDQLLQDLFSTYAPEIKSETATQNNIMQAFGKLLKQTEHWLNFNDPMGVYVYCLECEGL